MRAANFAPLAILTLLAVGPAFTQECTVIEPDVFPDRHGLTSDVNRIFCTDREHYFRIGCPYHVEDPDRKALAVTYGTVPTQPDENPNPNPFLFYEQRSPSGEWGLRRKYTESLFRNPRDFNFDAPGSPHFPLSEVRQEIIEIAQACPVKWKMCEVVEFDTLDDWGFTSDVNGIFCTDRDHYFRIGCYYHFETPDQKISTAVYGTLEDSPDENPNPFLFNSKPLEGSGGWQLREEYKEDLLRNPRDFGFDAPDNPHFPLSEVRQEIIEIGLACPAEVSSEFLPGEIVGEETDQ